MAADAIGLFVAGRASADGAARLEGVVCCASRAGSETGRMDLLPLRLANGFFC